MVCASIETEEGAMIKRLVVLFSIVLGLGFGCIAWAQSPTGAATQGPAKSLSASYGTVLTVHGKIVNVNRLEKQVTVEGADGQKVTLNVMNPYNLDAAKVGAPFVARYYETIRIRKKKPGENVPTATLSSGVTTAKPGGVPGATSEVQGELLVKVDAIDLANGTVTVEAPDGTTQTVKARNRQNLKRLKVGDELVISDYRAVAISLEKHS
jgi:hypothetical protein